MRLPLWLRMKIKTEDARFGFYIPLLLLYLLLLPLALLLLAVMLIMLLLPGLHKRGKEALTMAGGILKLLPAAAGTEINLQSEDDTIIFHIF